MKKRYFYSGLAAFCILISITGFSQSIIFTIANCGGEHRSGLYHDQLSSIMWHLEGKEKFTADSILKFTKNSDIQLKNLKQQSNLFKKSLPKDFNNDFIKIIRLDTKPNEDGRIWFDCIYAEQDLKGNIIIYSGFRAVFDGTDPVEERKHPKISQINVLLDKNQLQSYQSTIRMLLASDGVKLPPPQKKNPDAGKAEKPPEVELLR